jgi:hypothetical protein
VELVRPQLVCPCQRYPPLDFGRIHCEKYAIFFLSTPLNIKVSLTIRYGYQVPNSVFVVLLFSCRPCDIYKSHLQVALTERKGRSRHNYRSPTVWYVFIFLSSIISFVDCKKSPCDQPPVTLKPRVTLSDLNFSGSWFRASAITTMNKTVVKEHSWNTQPTQRHTVTGGCVCRKLEGS